MNTQLQKSPKIWSLSKSVCVLCVLIQSYPTLCNPMDYSQSGSSVYGIFQTRLLEQVAISSSRGSSWLRDQTHVYWVSCMCRWILYHRATWEPLASIEPFGTSVSLMNN